MTAPTTLAPRPRADGTEPCRADGVDPDVFFPDDEDAGLEAAAVYCRACPLIAECLAWAVDAREPGIWAATTTAQREQLRAEHGITTRIRNLTPKEIRTMTTALKPSPAAYAPGTTAAVTAELARQATAETAADTAPAAVDVPVEWKDTPAASGAAVRRHAVDPKAVRAWAAESGVECNAHGIVRHDVVDAYLAAQPATEASA
ncbi:MAG: hypothetical protein HOU01_26830 [Streptomycetaceae bacterium]|nr:hypothetical protein [Streptomycetaceae bacterium]